MNYSNPVKSLLIEDYPLGGKARGICKFEVEHKPKLGYRAVRTTQNKYGGWNKPKTDTYNGRIAFVRGDDNRTYVLKEIVQYRGIQVSQHDFMNSQEGTVYQDSNPERYATLLALVEAGQDKASTIRADGTVTTGPIDGDE